MSNIRSLEFYVVGIKNWWKIELKGVLVFYLGYEILKIYELKCLFVFEIKIVDYVYCLVVYLEDEFN